jgi:hypothetical protein
LDQELTFDAACRYVGRLYLSGQQDIDRVQAVYEARLKTLEAQLEAERTKRRESEQLAIDLKRQLRDAHAVVAS